MDTDNLDKNGYKLYVGNLDFKVGVEVVAEMGKGSQRGVPLADVALEWHCSGQGNANSVMCK